MNALTTKIAAQKIATLQEIARNLVNDFQDGADMVLDATLAQLEAVMGENEFVSFCEELEAA